MFEFKVLAQEGFARAGVYSTPHGEIKTPVFMPVGTQASVKALSSEDMKDLETPILLGNTYHLYLRPGHELLRELGGLHAFMKWDGPILTDSGGYQVSSLGHFKGDRSSMLSQIDDEGVNFTSHIDGSRHRFTPELAMEIQEALGSDIMMAFDEATPDKGYDYAVRAMERTHAWLERSIRAFERLAQKRTGEGKPPQALFGIVQGGEYEDLRKISAEYIVRHDVHGIAIGGATIGQSYEETEKNISYIREYIPENKPFYAMGVGVGPDHLLEVIKSGADMCDCVAPTKLARTGLIYDAQLIIPNNSIYEAYFESEYEKLRYSIGKRRYANDTRTLSEGCTCFTCNKGYTRAYLHHLYKAKEIAYHRFASIHNLHVMIQTATMAREALVSNVPLS